MNLQGKILEFVPFQEPESDPDINRLDNDTTVSLNYTRADLNSCIDTRDAVYSDLFFPAIEDYLEQIRAIGRGWRFRESKTGGIEVHNKKERINVRVLFRAINKQKQCIVTAFIVEYAYSDNGINHVSFKNPEHIKVLCAKLNKLLSIEHARQEKKKERLSI